MTYVGIRRCRLILILPLKLENDLDKIRRFYRNQIFDAMELHLSHAPRQESRSRIKRLNILSTAIDEKDLA